MSERELIAHIWTWTDDNSIETYCRKHGIVYAGFDAAAAEYAALSHDHCRVIESRRAITGGTA